MRKNVSRLPEAASSARSSPRVQSVRDIRISYEGQNGEILVKPPNLSMRGMFINTNRILPEGAVLNLRFNLVLTGAEVRTRCEVRNCQPGIGVGVEFIGLPPEEAKKIEREIQLSTRRPPRPRSRKTLTRAFSKVPRKHRR
jgi:PilZ domain